MSAEGGGRRTYMSLGLMDFLAYYVPGVAVLVFLFVLSDVFALGLQGAIASVDSINEDKYVRGAVWSILLLVVPYVLGHLLFRVDKRLAQWLFRVRPKWSSTTHHLSGCCPWLVEGKEARATKRWSWSVLPAVVSRVLADLLWQLGRPPACRIAAHWKKLRGAGRRLPKWCVASLQWFDSKQANKKGRRISNGQRKPKRWQAERGNELRAQYCALDSPEFAHCLFRCFHKTTAAYNELMITRFRTLSRFCHCMLVPTLLLAISIVLVTGREGIQGHWGAVATGTVAFLLIVGSFWELGSRYREYEARWRNGVCVASHEDVRAPT